jgi:hypothetical protein
MVRENLEINSLDSSGEQQAGMSNGGVLIA